MKKVKQSISEQYRGMQLQKRDILEIIDMLKEHTDNIELEIGDYRLDSIDEFDLIQDHFVRKFKIGAHFGYLDYICVSMEPHQLSVYSSSNQPIFLGLKSTIENMIIERNRFSCILRRYHVETILGIIFIALSFRTVIGSMNNHSLVGIYISAFLCICSISYFMYITNHFRVSCRLLLGHKLTFWEKHEKTVLAGAITLIVGIIVLLFQYFVLPVPKP